MSFNWGNAAMGAAALGPLGMGLGFGGGDKPKKLPTMDKNQQALFKAYIDRLGGLEGMDEASLQYLMDLMNPDSEAVSQFTAPYMREFNEKTVPGLAERFAGMGAMGGGLSSSGFGQSLSAAGAGLQEKLAALKSGLGMEAANRLSNTYNQRTGTAFGTPTFAYAKPQQGMWETLGPQLLQSLPALMTMA